MEQSERTSRETRRPVDRVGPRIVVVGVDETVTALRAVCYAAGIARRSRARLIVVHVKRPVVPIWGVLGVWGPPDVEPKEPKEESVVLGQAVFLVQRTWDDIDPELRVGDPVRELCRVADDSHADMVIVGSSQALRHRLCGSVPARLLARGHWPVVVVP
jgi:nucleotide-binding universal stress UspA family protein